jgi:site-specific recombinase XerD
MIWRRGSEALKKNRTNSNIESDGLFLNQCNEGARSKKIQRAVQYFAKKAELKNVTPHPLRHSFAIALFASGVPIGKFATLSGHSNPNTIGLYTTPGEEETEDWGGKIEY